MFSSNKEYVNILSSKAETKAITRTNTEKGVQPHFIQKEIIKNWKRIGEENKKKSLIQNLNVQSMNKTCWNRPKKTKRKQTIITGMKDTKKGMNTNTTIRNNM